MSLSTNKTPLVFETSKLEILQYFAARLGLGFIFVILVYVGLNAYLQSQFPETTQLVNNTAITGFACGISLMTLIVLFIILTGVAVKLSLSDEELIIETFAGEKTLKWDQIAGVRTLHGLLQTSYYILTKSGRQILVSPTIDPLVVDELKSRVKQSNAAFYAAHFLSVFRYGSGTIAAMAAAFALYLLWNNLRDPALELNSYSDKSNPIYASCGNNAFIHEYSVRNFGRQSKGLELKLSGSALAAHLVSNPSAMLISQQESQLNFPKIVNNQVRQFIQFKKENNDVWSATSNSIILPHKDDFMVESLNLFPMMMGANKISMRNEFRVQIFADAKSKGSGSLALEITPLDCAHASALSTDRIEISAKHNALDPLPCESVPGDFPLSAYPGSTVVILSKYQVRLDSPYKAIDVINYYKKELENKGWQLSLKPNKPPFDHDIDATKGKSELSLDIIQYDGHTSIDIFNGEQPSGTGVPILPRPRKASQ